MKNPQIHFHLFGSNIMLKTKRLVNVSLLTIGLNACSMFEMSQCTGTRLCTNDDGTFYTCQDMALQNITQYKEVSESHSSLFSTDLHFNQLGEYTEQMAVDIQQDLKGTQVDSEIVVASFVYLDSALQPRGQLGNQLAENFINDLQQIGLPVSDHKLTGTLDMNGAGDFVFSRDTSQISNLMEIGYVFSGTMQKNSRGVIVNARLMNFNTKRVIASSSKFIPDILLENIL